MNYHILTLFPEMVTQGLSESILGRAAKKGLLSVNAVNIRDYTADRHKKVDDYPYGGGAGMLMQAEPVYLAYQSIEEKIAISSADLYGLLQSLACCSRDSGSPARNGSLLSYILQWGGPVFH